MAIHLDPITLSHLQANDQQTRGWFNARDKALKYYNGNVNEFTKLKLSDNMIRNITLPNNNITKRIVDRISLVYIEDATRKVDSDVYQAAIKNKDAHLLIAERRTNLLNLIALKISWRHDAFQYDTLEVFHPEFDDDPLVPTAISFPLAVRSNVNNTKAVVWQRWTADTIEEIDTSGKVVSQIENELGLLPFVYPVTEKPQDGFLKIDPADDLVEMNEVLNVMLSDLILAIRYQSAPTVYIIGADEDSELEVPTGPDQWVNITAHGGEKPQVGVLDASPQIESVTKTIAHIYGTIAQNYHLPVGFVEGQPQAESGIALRVRNTELLDNRKGDVKRWRTLENEIYVIERKIIEARLDKKIQEEFSVDFGEHSLVLTRAEQRDDDEWQLERNMITPAQILVRDDPDNHHTEKEAQKFINDNAAKVDTTQPVDTQAVTLADVLAT